MGRIFMGLFGTNGVRGIANEYINPELAVNLARSIVASFAWASRVV
jgi:phosphomannomutase